MALQMKLSGFGACERPCMKAHKAPVVGIQLQPASRRLGMVKEADGPRAYLNRHRSCAFRRNTALDSLGYLYRFQCHNTSRLWVPGGRGNFGPGVAPDPQTDPQINPQESSGSREPVRLPRSVTRQVRFLARDSVPYKSITGLPATFLFPAKRLRPSVPIHNS